MTKYEYFQYAHFCFVIALFMSGFVFDYRPLKTTSMGIIFGIAIAYFIRGWFSDD